MGAMFDACGPLAEVIAKVQWERHVEEEQGKSDYDVDVPSWDELGSHQDYLISQARPIAWSVWKAGWRPPEAAPTT